MKFPRVLLFCIAGFLFPPSIIRAQHPSLDLNDTMSLSDLIGRYGQPPVQNHNGDQGGVRDNRPNILFIMVDDSRYDSYTCNGGHSFFPTPNIDRISNEGANFRSFFAVLPLCSPSRATFLTGLYPHKSGVVNNEVDIKSGLPWISSILQQSGYYTGFAGKLGFDPDSIRGFDRYMIAITESYMPAKYAYWTGDTVIKVWLDEHTTDVITDYVLDMIDARPPDQPFFMYLPHRAPHVPYIPRPEDAHLFDSIPMPYPNNNKKYNTNFPSYYYPENQAGDSINQDTTYRGYFQMLAGVEATTGKILHYLDSTGLIDNTIIIYTSDNGNLKSEHQLQGKQLPQEESIRLPFLVRYPGWFAPNTNIYQPMCLNIDWAPTLLDAAGIPDTFGMDGKSVRALANGEASRDQFLYEVWQESGTPSIRAIRTEYFKYIRSFCDDTVEQLFDMINDPAEDTSVLNDPAYHDIVLYLRCKLDSVRASLDDLGIDTIIECHLKNYDTTHIRTPIYQVPPFACILPPFDGDGAFDPVGIESPSLAEKGSWDLSIYNLFGQLVIREEQYSRTDLAQLQLSHTISPGLYIAVFESKSQKIVKKMIVQ